MPNWEIILFMFQARSCKEIAQTLCGFDVNDHIPSSGIHSPMIDVVIFIFH